MRRLVREAFDQHSAAPFHDALANSVYAFLGPKGETNLDS